MRGSQGYFEDRACLIRRSNHSLETMTAEVSANASRLWPLDSLERIAPDNFDAKSLEDDRAKLRQTLATTWLAVGVTEIHLDHALVLFV